MSSEISLLRLRVSTESDPNALSQVIQRFQNLNIVPRRLSAEFGSNEVLHIQVDVCGVPEGQLALITRKIQELPTTLRAHWHRVV